MDSLAYVELHRQVAGDIEAEIAAALERLGPSTAVKDTVARLLRHQKMKHPLSVLPLLVHAAETGVTGPAVPVAAVHVLWWTSACYLDDLADGHGTADVEGLDVNEALLAAVVGGQVLINQIIRSHDLSEPVRAMLTAEVENGWIAAAEGQLSDIRADVAGVSCKSVTEAYRGKSGAPFGMITAMGAAVSGASAERQDAWREFGYVFGVLWQIFNDQEDILSGRDEDLRNGTVTYLLACAVEEAPPGSGEHILGLLTESGTSARARSEITRLLLTPTVLGRYRDDTELFRRKAHVILDRLGGDAHHLSSLRQLVDESARIRLSPQQPGRPSENT